MRVDVVTIFPDYFGPASGVGGPLGVSLIGKAAARGDVNFHIHDLRQWAMDVHHTVDDTPFGGGPGMVMKADVWGTALDAIPPVEPAATVPRLVVPTPSGVPFSQERALAYAGERHLVFACGRYEGIDSRVVADARSATAVDEVSIGDYVLAGAEAAVCVILEAVGRLLPGVLGNEQSAADDSFGGGAGEEGDPMRGLLEGPVYTRPRSWRGREVPSVLLSGDHKAIARWRRDEALRRTAAVRPDLVSRMVSGAGGGAGILDARDRTVLAEAGFPVDGESMAH
jgi:tRNA (guanine37-N1)-methyltransferase